MLCSRNCVLLKTYYFRSIHTSVSGLHKESHLTSFTHSANTHLAHSVCQALG